MAQNPFMEQVPALRNEQLMTLQMLLQQPAVQNPRGTGDFDADGQPLSKLTRQLAPQNPGLHEFQRRQGNRQMLMNHMLGLQSRQRAAESGLPASTLTPGPIGAAATDRALTTRGLRHQVEDEGLRTQLGGLQRQQEFINTGPQNFDDPLMQASMGAQQAFAGTGFGPGVQSTILNTVRAQQERQQRAQLAQQREQAQIELQRMRDGAAAGRLQMTDETRRRAQDLTALIQRLNAQLNVERYLPEGWFGGGPSEALQGGISELESFGQGGGGQINTGPAVDFPAQEPRQDQGQQAGQYQVGEIIDVEGTQYEVIGIDPDGVPRVRPVR